MSNKNRNLAKASMLAMLLSGASVAVAQEPVDYSKYPDYVPANNPDWSLMVPGGGKGSRAATDPLPDHWNNADTKYFPPVFNQDGGSCGSASRIAYMFNHEINAFRHVDGSLEENQYPTHFTWLLTNCGSNKETIAMNNGVPNVPTYGGRTFSGLFGNQDCSAPDFGWMQGYDRWYQAMFNRVDHNANLPVSVESEEGREALKRWLYNHNGDTDYATGGIAGIGLASGGYWKDIADDPQGVNKEIGMVGKKYVSRWGKGVDHALTIVGWDDRIVFDLNGNGIYGEKDADEIGAWIIVNSWGSGWCNNGFIYCPYRNAVSVSTPDNAAEESKNPGGDWSWTPNSGNYYKPEIYYIRKNYRPLRTIKIRMSYSHRSEIQVQAGISSNVTASSAEKTISMHHFDYDGDGTNASVAPEVPMLGRWGSEMNYEPMEFGYDLTDLSASFNTRKPLKYFLIINTKSNARGTGKIECASIIDYEFDENGVEIPFAIEEEGTTIDGRTVLSVVVQGEPLYAPTDVVLSENVLTWKAPKTSTYALTGYNVYRDGELLAKVDKGALTFTDEAMGTASHSYYVTAVYECKGKDAESHSSNTVRRVVMTEASAARHFTNSGFVIPNVFDKNYSECTIDFWIKPASLTNYNQQMGPGWGKFLIHANSDGSLSVGWANNSSGRINVAGALGVNRWTHVAIAVQQNRMTVFVNGTQKGSVSSSSYSGLGGFGDLEVGVSGNALDGSIADFRIWDYAWAAKDATANLRQAVADVSLHPHLIAYYRMDDITQDGKLYLNDCVGGNHGILMDESAQSKEDFEEATSANRINANFTYEGGTTSTYYVGETVHLVNASSLATTRLEWTVEDAGITNASSPELDVKFTEAGNHSVKLRAYNAAGNSNQVSKIVRVLEMPEPTADFNMSTSKPIIGETVYLASVNPIEGCTYEWTMPGATIESSTSPTVAVMYLSGGKYTITLKVISPDGKAYTETKEIETTLGPPQAELHITPSVVLKGEKVYLEDRSTLSPEEWVWGFAGTNNGMIVEGANSSFEPEKPGAYDVSLFVSNAYGTDRDVRKRGLIVCNADGGTGLNFTGSNPVVTSSAPWTGSASAFTIEWWMNATNLSAAANEIGDKASTLLMNTTTAGAFAVSVNGVTVTSAPKVVLPNEWHHYAVMFNAGTLSFYRDGELVDEQTCSATSVPELAELHLGSTAVPMRGIVDEFRVWTKALDLTTLQTYANEPIADIAAATGEGLVLYYGFNQSGGDVEDLSGKNHVGVRTGFGPDGDAWGSSLGIFCLNFADRVSDMTRTSMKNYQAPFLTNDIAVANGEALQTGTARSTWIIENAIAGTPTTGFYVNTSDGSMLECTTSANGFASSLSNHKLYTPTTLTTGIYEFTVTPNPEVPFPESESYIVVGSDKSFPDYDPNGLWSAIAIDKLTAGEVSFAIAGSSDVLLGINANLAANQRLSIESFILKRKPHRYYKANGETVGIDGITADNSAASDVDVEPVAGGVRLSSDVAKWVRIYDAAGRTVKHFELTQPVTVPLAKGVYIINGERVAVN